MRKTLRIPPRIPGIESALHHTYKAWSVRRRWTMPCAALSSQVEGIAAQIGSGSSLLALSSHVESVETSSWGIRRVGALSSHVEGVPPQPLPIAAGIGGQGTSGRYLLGLLFPAGSAVPRRDC